MKVLHNINFVFTAITTLGSLLFIGLLLAMPLGAFQLFLFVILLLNKNLNKEAVKTHLKIYGVLAVMDIAFLLVATYGATDLVLATPVIGLALAWYNVWITKQLYKNQTVAI